jgi:carboxyl-terminal processing protease
MARALLVVCSLVAAAETWAAPRPAIAPPVKDPKALQQEARRFAVQVHCLIEQVAEHYVRPVTREALLEAALAGLYQAARQTVPRDLRDRVRVAVAEATLLRASGRPFNDPRERLLARAREQLGAAEALAGQNTVLVCCQALARVLDPHSGLVTAEEQRRAVGLDHESLGVGLEFKDGLAGPLVVDQVQLGSPAQRAGLRPGDVITRIDGRPAGKAPPEVLSALRNQRVLAQAPPVTPAEADKGTPQGPPATLRVSYRRAGQGEARSVTLLRERFRPESVLGVRRRDDNGWDYLVDARQGLAHVRLAALSRGTSEEFRAVLATLKGHKVRGVLLDLRWCPGGYLNEAVEVADLFLGAGVIATVKTRGREDTVYRSGDADKLGDFGLVVLVNGETSGGAELVAAALQDHRRAVLVGQRTLGKASVQTPLAVGIDGVGFKLTSGTFVRPSGKNLHRFADAKPDTPWGVTPEEDSRVSPELGKRLKEWWQQYSLRPARSYERLPLDDPRADPQQQEALAVLRRLLDRKARARAE